MTSLETQHVKLSPITVDSLVYPVSFLVRGKFSNIEKWWSDLSAGFDFPYLSFTVPSTVNTLKGNNGEEMFDYYYLCLLPGFRSTSLSTNSKYYGVELLKNGSNYPVMVPLREFRNFDKDKVDLGAWQTMLSLLLPPVLDSDRYDGELYSSLPAKFGEMCEAFVYRYQKVI